MSLECKQRGVELSHGEEWELSLHLDRTEGTWSGHVDISVPPEFLLLHNYFRQSTFQVWERGRRSVSINVLHIFLSKRHIDNTERPRTFPNVQRLGQCQRRHKEEMCDLFWNVTPQNRESHRTIFYTCVHVCVRVCITHRMWFVTPSYCSRLSDMVFGIFLHYSYLSLYLGESCV
jgi:hypothetical protein